MHRDDDDEAGIRQVEFYFWACVIGWIIGLSVIAAVVIGSLTNS